MSLGSKKSVLEEHKLVDFNLKIDALGPRGDPIGEKLVQYEPLLFRQPLVFEVGDCPAGGLQPHQMKGTHT
jgi:hypothetical protein